MMPTWPWPAASFLIALTVLAYMPVISGGGFIWDDLANVTENLLLRSVHGLWEIWTKVGPSMGGTFQYYPLTYTAFWAEYQLWQLRPLGYHLINVLLHALNAVLVWRILRRLRVPGALLAAAIFALHPVHVESVAWITELKNILSGLFYLLSLRCYLRFLSVPGFEPETPAKVRRGYWAPHFLAMFLFLCALASKTLAGTLPAAILLILWWKTGRIGWKNLLLVAPMLALGLGSGLLTAHVEMHQGGAEGTEWALTPVEHCLLAGRALWFYAGKLIWPGKLMFIYPRWELSQALWRQVLFPLAAIAAIGALWIVRKKIGRGPVTAVLFFAGTLAPALGFANVYFTRYSYVADHFQYLASLGLIVLFSAAATQACLRLGPGARKVAMPAAGAMLLTLGTLTWLQGGIYKSSDRVWSDTIKKNPACWLAHNNWGVALVGQGRLDEAAAHFQEALRLKPDFVEPHFNRGAVLARQGRLEEALVYYREALRLKPDYVEAQNNWGLALAELGKVEEAIVHYREALRLNPDFAEAHNSLGLALAGQGRLGEAAAQYREALRIKPNYPEAHNNLGVALAREGRLEEALEHYQEASRLKPNYAEAHNNWGLTLAGQGQLAVALAHYQEALRIKPDYVEAHSNLGIALARQGRLEDAIAQFSEALRLKPNSVEAYNNWGMALAAQGRLDEAAARYREALRLKPDFAEARNNLGIALAGLDRLGEAVAQYREALRSKPDYVEAHNNLGIALARQGRLEEAGAHFRAALKIAPNNANARKNLAILLNLKRTGQSR